MAAIKDLTIFLASYGQKMLPFNMAENSIWTKDLGFLSIQIPMTQLQRLYSHDRGRSHSPQPHRFRDNRHFQSSALSYGHISSDHAH